MEQATLSLAREGASDRMLAVDLRRADIESALESAADGRVELLLDIAAREADGETAERHTLTVDCTIADLERLLESSSDTVRVGFDAEALARAIREPDIGGARAAREDGSAGHRRRDDRRSRRRRAGDAHPAAGAAAPARR